MIILYNSFLLNYRNKVGPKIDFKLIKTNPKESVYRFIAFRKAWNVETEANRWLVFPGYLLSQTGPFFLCR